MTTAQVPALPYLCSYGESCQWLPRDKQAKKKGCATYADAAEDESVENHAKKVEELRAEE